MHKTHSKPRNDRFNANRDDRMNPRFAPSSAGYREQAEGRWMNQERSEELAEERAQYAQFANDQFDQGYRDRGYGTRAYGDVDHGAIDRSYRASDRSYGDRSFVSDYTSQYGDRGYVGPNSMSDMEDSWARRSASRGDFDRDYRNDRWSYENRLNDDRSWSAEGSIDRVNYGGAYSGGFSMPRPQFIGKGPKGYTRSDERIREEICELLSEGHLDASNIEVAVKDGQVTLSGTVTTRRVKRLAEEIAESARGVKDIENKLKLAKAEHADKPVEGGHKHGHPMNSPGSNDDSSTPSLSTKEPMSSKRQVHQA